ncbi:hypothetical protein [Brevibacillus formosus]|uniref:hypothetical protein n=1 Tax=Brevibacillus formosus TaxID=54913 RepID=UPI00215940EE|nr:hypothetical protein [Brevibacillus formosus]
MSATRLVKSRMRLLFSLLCLIMGMTMLLAPASTTAKTYQKAVWIPVDSTIERGLESFLHRAFADAQKQQADLVILHINTPGGEVNAADSGSHACDSLH